MEKINKWHVEVMDDFSHKGFTDFTIFHAALSIYAHASMTVLDRVKVRIEAEIINNQVRQNIGSMPIMITLKEWDRSFSVRMPIGEIKGRFDLEKFVSDAVSRRLAELYLDEIT